MVIDKASPLFEAMGGMHNVYIDSTGETALKNGESYPDKAVLLVDLHEFTISDGSYVEGPRLRVFNLHPVSARWISRYDLGARVWLRSGDLCEAVTSPCEVVEHTHD